MVGRSATMSGIRIPHPLGARRTVGARPVLVPFQVHPAPLGLSNDRAPGVGRDAAEVLALLSDAGRRHLLWILPNDEVDVSTPVAAVGGAIARTTQHLAKLRLAGWGDTRRHGRQIRYRVVDPHIVSLIHRAVAHVLHQRVTGRAGTARRDGVPRGERRPSSGCRPGSSTKLTCRNG